jgi:hypothetical protein
VEETVSKQMPVVSEDKNIWLYAVIGGLALLLILIGGWCLWLQRNCHGVGLICQAFVDEGIDLFAFYFHPIF